VILGLVLGLIMATIGLYWWQGKAEAEEARQNPDELPVLNPGQMTGPTTPEASELTGEQRRFFRYDRTRDWCISRNEMLSTRS